MKVLGRSLGLLMLTLGCSGYAGETSEQREPATTDSIFASFAPEATNGVGQVERYATCEGNQLLTGFGARVKGDNVLDVTVHCHAVTDDGTLDDEEQSFSDGGPSEEQVVRADRGQVLVGLGATVTHDNVYRLTASQCPWLAASMSLDSAQCSGTSTGGASTEVETSLQPGEGAATRDKTVLTGAGMTSTGDNTHAIMLKIALLK